MVYINIITYILSSYHKFMINNHMLYYLCTMHAKNEVSKYLVLPKSRKCIIVGGLKLPQAKIRADLAIIL